MLDDLLTFWGASLCDMQMKCDLFKQMRPNYNALAQHLALFRYSCSDVDRTLASCLSSLYLQRGLELKRTSRMTWWFHKCVWWHFSDSTCWHLKNDFLFPQYWESLMKKARPFSAFSVAPVWICLLHAHGKWSVSHFQEGVDTQTFLLQLSIFAGHFS